MSNLGVAFLHLGDHGAAVASFEEALTGMQRFGDDRSTAKILSNLGLVQLYRGNVAAARESFERGLAIGARTLSALEIAGIQNNLASTLDNAGDLRNSQHAQKNILDTFQRVGDRWSQTATLITLGNLQLQAGQPEAAAESHRAALALAVDIGAQYERVSALRGLGSALAAMGDNADARGHLGSAVELARQLQAPTEEARSLTALADLLERSDNSFEANSLRRQAASILANMTE
jgi:tetratricopeptide (TPR) repeat protein